MKKIDIEKKIIYWFKINKKKITKKNFLEEGLLDSFDMISLISYIENDLNVKFKPTDFQKRNFATIKNLVDLVKKYRV